MFLISLIVLLIVVYCFIRYYLSPPTVWCKSQRCLVGKTVIITGANTGLGFKAALDLAKRGAKIILACRDKQRGEEARLEIMKQTENPLIFVKTLDMSSLSSVEKFCKEINELEDRLDILINNAGITFAYNSKSEDNLNLVMQVNYYSHFLLTILLLDLLKKNPSRIVNVASLAAAYVSKFNIKEIDTDSWFLDTYAKSKLCNILFTKELAKRLADSNVTTFSVHPGAIKTGIFRTSKGIHKYLIDVFVALFYKDLEHGTQTIISCAVANDLEQHSGRHFDNCKVVPDYKSARNRNLPEELWNVTEKILGLNKDQ